MLKGYFNNGLVSDFNNETGEHILAANIVFTRSNGNVILVNEGFSSFLYSTINIPWLSRNGKLTAASIIHDFLYRGEFFPRKISDIILAEASLTIGATQLQSKIIYTFARIFGIFKYARNTISSINVIRYNARIPNNENRPLWPDGIARFI